MKSHKNLQFRMETIDNKPLSITTGNFNKHDQGPGSVTILNDRRSLNQDETDQIL